MAEVKGKIDMLEPKGSMGTVKDEVDASVVEPKAVQGITIERVITIFANALGNLLRLKGDKDQEENEGIVVEIDSHKYIVFVAQDMAVHIADASPEHFAGQRVWVHFGNPDEYEAEDKDTKVVV